MSGTQKGRKETLSAVRRSRGLVVAGLASAGIYLVLAGRLSWWQYGERLQSWAELLGDGPVACALCLGGIGMLMALYLWGLRQVRRGRAERRTIWGFALAFAAALFWLMPITSDLFSYLTQAHMLTDLRANPLVQAPIAFQDPLLLSYRTAYAVRPSAYGPAWILLSAVGTLGPHDVPAGLFYLKGLAVVAYVSCAWLIEEILQNVRPAFALEGLYLFAWNPFVLLMAVGDGHNDIVLMALVLLSIWFLQRERWALAFGVLALSVWIKYVSLVLVPFFGLCLWRRRKAGMPESAIRPAALAGLAALAVTVLVATPLASPYGLVGIVKRMVQPLNWRDGASGMPALLLGVGLSLFLVAWGVLVVRVWKGNCGFRQAASASFLAMLLVFLLGMARSQPWHLLWGAALGGLAEYRWAQPLIVGLSGLMLVVQVGVEWAQPILAG